VNAGLLAFLLQGVVQLVMMQGQNPRLKITAVMSLQMEGLGLEPRTTCVRSIAQTAARAAMQRGNAGASKAALLPTAGRRFNFFLSAGNASPVQRAIFTMEALLAMDGLQHWDSNEDGEGNDVIDPTIKYNVSARINRKIAIWDGDVRKLQIEAIVNSTNNTLMRETPIMKAAGDEMKEEVHKMIGTEGLKTGEAIVTGPCKLPCDKLIHTVGPIFKEKYKTAATSALHSCYLNSLKVMKEAELRTIAFPCIYTKSQKFPRDEAANVAARTVRKFLDKFGDDVDLIIFVLNSQVDMDIYSNVLPLYFPRNQQEQGMSEKTLPDLPLTEFGDIKLADRQIRVANLPAAQATAEGALNRTSQLTAFRGMSDGPDARKEDKPAVKAGGWFGGGGGGSGSGGDSGAGSAGVGKEKNEAEYNKYLRRARGASLEDIEALNVVFKSGRDNFGRTVLVFVPANLPDKPDWDMLMLHIIRKCDIEVSKPFVFVYFNPKDAKKRPDFGWLRNMWSNILVRKYKKNVQYIYVVHPTMWVKTLIAFLRPFVSTKVWRKLVQVAHVSDLSSCIASLEVPPHVDEYDKSYNKSIFDFSSNKA
jgi:O-acetyl-ADP-ribose deacetylase (regulator of RNase III)